MDIICLPDRSRPEPWNTRESPDIGYCVASAFRIAQSGVSPR
jgi:hypothetical protein